MTEQKGKVLVVDDDTIARKSITKSTKNQTDILNELYVSLGIFTKFSVKYQQSKIMPI